MKPIPALSFYLNLLEKEQLQNKRNTDRFAILHILEALRFYLDELKNEQLQDQCKLDGKNVLLGEIARCASQEGNFNDPFVTIQIPKNMWKAIRSEFLHVR